MSAGRMVSARELVGKRIVAFNPGTYKASEGRGAYRTMHQPTITLDDGSVLSFMTEEHPDASASGTFIGRYVPSRPEKP